MNPNYCDTVTIYNRLKAADSPDKKEHWKKTVLERCSYNSAMIRSAGANQQTFLQMDLRPEYTVRIPKNPSYRPYHEWKQDQIGFTLSAGDLSRRDRSGNKQYHKGASPVCARCLYYQQDRG